MEITGFLYQLVLKFKSNELRLMNVTVNFIDNTHDKAIDILTKENNGLANAYIPKSGEIVEVYSKREHETFEFNVGEVQVIILPDSEIFNVLLIRTN